MSKKTGKSRSRSRLGKNEVEREKLAFKVLNEEQTKMLLELETVEEVQEKLKEIFNIFQPQLDLKEASVLDYYTAGFWWAKEQHFTVEQQSAFFTALHKMLDNVKEKHFGVIECLKDFKKMFSGLGQENADFYGGFVIFDLLQAKAITDYLYTSMFQHYKLYEFMFSTTQAEEIIGTDLEIDVAKAASVPWPPPLEEGLTQEIYDTFVMPQPDEEECEEETDMEEAAPEVTEEHMRDILSQLTPEEIKRIMQDCFDTMLGGLTSDVASKLRDKENSYLSKINKIHVPAK